MALNKLENLPHKNDIVTEVEVNNVLGLTKIFFVDPWSGKTSEIVVQTIKE